MNIKALTSIAALVVTGTIVLSGAWVAIKNPQDPSKGVSIMMGGAALLWRTPESPQ